MFNIFLIYVIVVVYLFIGYQIHEYMIKELRKDNYGNKLYSMLGATSRVIVCLVTIVFWLPMFIGEIIYSVFMWIANYYEE
jgi:hypothetical protein